MLASIPILGHRLYPVCLAASLSLSAAAQCGFEWQPSQPMAGTSNRIEATASVPGLGLYAVGRFEAAGSVLANHIALWNGSEWSAIGSGVNGIVHALAADPNGDLVVGGRFLSAGGNPAARLASWNGLAWSPYAGGTNSIVTCLGRMPNGDLFAGGSFTLAGGQPVNRAGVWDGSTWTQVGTGVDDGVVNAMVVRPNGDIVVGGNFSSVGGVTTGPLAIWNGTTWTSPGVAAGAVVYALANDSNGDLLIGGGSLNAQGAKLARWNGSSMQNFGAPVSFDIRTILVRPSGAILVGSAFDFGNGSINSVARLENGAWTVIKTGAHVTSLIEHNGNVIAAGGQVGSVTGPNIEQFDGSSWSSLGGVYSTGLLEHVAADPSGGVFVAGALGSIGNQVAPRVAHWDGNTWSGLGGGVDGDVTDMVVAANGDLVVAGEFTIAGGAPANHIASWNGSNWVTLGAGSAVPARKLASRQAGGVIALFADAPSVRVFDGFTWSALPQPAILPNAAVSVVEMPNGDLVVGTADGSGILRWNGSAWSTMSALTATELTLAPGGTLLAAASDIYKWNGQSFQSLGHPVGVVSDVLGLPNGDVIATGLLFNAIVTGVIMRWDGVEWTPVDGEHTIPFNGLNPMVEATFTPAGELVVVGSFGVVGQVVTANIARAVSTCPASVSSFGSGCSGSAGSVSMAPLNQPWLGSTFEAQTTGMAPISLAVHAVGTTSVLASLPLGAPGCSLYLQPSLLALAIPNAGTVMTSFAIPTTAALVGMSVRTQTIGVELDASMSLTSLTSSNALDLTIGAF